MPGLAALVVCWLLACTGCVAPAIEEGQIMVGALRTIDPEGQVVRRGDQLAIRFTYEPGRNQAVTVRPDGKISIPFAEEVVAAGRTVEELDEILSEQVSRHLVNGDLTVIVRQRVRHQVYVAGEVRRPGVVGLEPGMTLHHAVLASGDFKRSAATDSVILVRDLGPGLRGAEKLDLSEEGMVRGDYQLQPFDLVYVPRTSISRVSQWLRQHVSNLLPKGVRIVAFSYHYGLQVDL